jgi:hypothetical protein
MPIKVKAYGKVKKKEGGHHYLLAVECSDAAAVAEWVKIVRQTDGEIIDFGPLPGLSSDQGPTQ